jgi:protoporphyrin/coproporphyrin ferrochelatase
MPPSFQPDPRPPTPGPSYDALLVISFGGPERREDVIPFLENVLRGRNVPRERLLEVASHYEHFDGVSPINAQMRELIAALRTELAEHGIPLPIYWGNRNWHPYLSETLEAMTATGVKRALAYVTSAYSSYSSCRQYLDNIDSARTAAGENAPVIDKLRPFFNHPDFVAANVARLNETLQQFAPDSRDSLRLVFTAHSIPASMAQTCSYAPQLQETSRLVAEACGFSPDRWDLVYQSRSGRPQDPWLEPDILDHLRALHARGIHNVVLMPVGFLSDHIEVLYDLDTEARQLADELGLTLARAPTAGTHPLFIRMIRKLIEERLSGAPDRAAVGNLPPLPDACPVGCCPAPRRGP